MNENVAVSALALELAESLHVAYSLRSWDGRWDEVEAWKTAK